MLKGFIIAVIFAMTQFEASAKLGYTRKQCKKTYGRYLSSYQQKVTGQIIELYKSTYYQYGFIFKNNVVIYMVCYRHDSAPLDEVVEKYFFSEDSGWELDKTKREWILNKGDAVARYYDIKKKKVLHIASKEYLKLNGFK